MSQPKEPRFGSSPENNQYKHNYSKSSSPKPNLPNTQHNQSADYKPSSPKPDSPKLNLFRSPKRDPRFGGN